MKRDPNEVHDGCVRKRSWLDRVLVIGPYIVVAGLLIMPGRVMAGGNLSDSMRSGRSGGSGNHDSNDYSSDDDSSFGEALLGGFLEGLFAGIFGGNSDGDSDGSSGGGGGGGIQCAVQLPFDAEFVVPFNGVIQNMTRLSLTTFFEGEHAAFGFYLNGGFVNMENGSLPDTSTSSSSTVGTGAAFRYYFLRSDARLNPYVTTRLGWQSVSWTYRDRVSMDHLAGLDSYGGVGVTWHRNRPFSLFSEVGVGGNVFADWTYNGFRNDVFKDFPYFAAKAGMSFRF